MSNLVTTVCGQWVEIDYYPTHVRRCLSGCRTFRSEAEKKADLQAARLEDLRAAVKRGTHLSTHRAAAALLEAYDG